MLIKRTVFVLQNRPFNKKERKGFLFSYTIHFPQFEFMQFVVVEKCFGRTILMFEFEIFF